MLAVGLLASQAACAADARPSREYQLKAAFVYSFSKFVTWPATALPIAPSPIVIGVIGTDPFGGELEKAAAGRAVNGHPVLVRKVETVEQATRVHVLFVATTDEPQLQSILQAVAARPVLTVGESPEFARLGGIITFVLVEEKVRFAIEVSAANRAGLEVSSQLQNLATKLPGRK